MKVNNFSDLPPHIQKLNADKLENAMTASTASRKGLADATHDKNSAREYLEGLRNDSTVFLVKPVSKPRMTQRDKWLKPPRKAVSNYWTFKDELQAQAKQKNFIMPESHYHLIFYIEMPRSWSKKKKESMNLKPHQQKPDKDNLEKAFLDALLSDDSKVWDGRTTKLWAYESSIEVSRHREEREV